VWKTEIKYIKNQLIFFRNPTRFGSFLKSNAFIECR
jgi:hypothetical protein